MPWIRTLLQLSLLVPAYAASLTTRSERIAWGSCDEINGTLPIQCGNLTVPLDYTNPEPDATLNLQLLKVPAAKTPKKGSIMFNFGGPGLRARSLLASEAKKLQA